MNPFQTTPKKPKSQVTTGILESLRDLSTGVGRSVVSDIPKGMTGDALASLFGTPAPGSGELNPGQPVEFGGEKHRPAVYRRELSDQRPVPRTESGLKEKLDAVRMELKALASSIKSLNKEIEKAVSEAPVNPGIYHDNFFDRLRSMLRLLQEQVDNSQTWLAAFNGRKKKQGYWGMYKKHGTTFGLSHERNLATQAG